MTHNHSEPVRKETTNIAAEQRTRLKELFPEAFTEGQVDFAKDFRAFRGLSQLS